MTGVAVEPRLVFVPLGGAGEIGMNLNCYGFGPAGEERWLIVDFGIGFDRGLTPGIDVVMPDPTFIEERLSNLDGILLSHAHEDHLGALPYLWRRLPVPVYGTAFALAVLRRKLQASGMAPVARLVELAEGERRIIGAFDIELVSMTHSIPESNAIAIRTPLGTILHTGDWKLDADPVVGVVSDEVKLRRIGDEGVLAMIGDSTNALEEGTSGSEGSLLEPLTELVGRGTRRVFVTCFSTNIARLFTIVRAAEANGRKVALLGTALRRTVAAALECGYLRDLPAFLDEAALDALPPERTLVLCTGSQGEPNAALARLVRDEYNKVRLAAGDIAIFSSRVIPGNEAGIAIIHNELLRRGVDVITWRDSTVHVSGHPAHDELVRMYQLVRPRVAIPVHGELRHMMEHASIARACQVAQTIVIENGDMVHLAPGTSAPVETVAAGRLATDGQRVVALDGPLVRDRARAVYHGTGVVTVVLDGGGRVVTAPQMTFTGVFDGDESEHLPAITAGVRNALGALATPDRDDDAIVRSTVTTAVRRGIRALYDKRPSIHVHIVRLG